MLIWLVLFDLNRNGFGGVSNERAECGVLGEHLRHTRSVSADSPAGTDKGNQKQQQLFVSIKRADTLSTKPSCMHVFHRISFSLGHKIAFSYLQFRASSRSWTPRDATIPIWMERSTFHQMFASPLLFSTREGFEMFKGEPKHRKLLRKNPFEDHDGRKSLSKTLKSFSFGALWTRSRKEFIN